MYNTHDANTGALPPTSLAIRRKIQRSQFQLHYHSSPSHQGLWLACLTHFVFGTEGSTLSTLVNNRFTFSCGISKGQPTSLNNYSSCCVGTVISPAVAVPSMGVFFSPAVRDTSKGATADALHTIEMLLTALSYVLRPRPRETTLIHRRSVRAGWMGVWDVRREQRGGLSGESQKDADHWGPRACCGRSCQAASRSCLCDAHVPVFVDNEGERAKFFSGHDCGRLLDTY